MDKHNIFVFCFIFFAVTTLTEAKTYRNDYEYNIHTDAFYKLHITTHSHLLRGEVCELEGAKLMPPMSIQELSQVHALINHNQWQYSEDIDEVQHQDATEGQTIIDLESETKDVLEMSCQVTTRDGYVNSKSVVRDQPFVCKIEAKDVFYDPQCRVHARGYRFFPSVGSCYKIPRAALTWRQAVAECQAYGAHLAVINSDLEANLLKNMSTLVNDTPNSELQDFFLIGFRAVKLTEPRVFKTIFNQTLGEAGFSEWIPGDPNNSGGIEHCGSFHKTGKLNDTTCKIRLGFICEKEVIFNHHNQ